MATFKRGTILKLTCDVHEFLAKAPKAYEDLIDIIDGDGKVKVKTHNGDYVGLYGMKAKIHTRFMKQFEVVGEMPCDNKVPLSLASHVDVAKWRDCDNGLIGEVTKWCEAADIQPNISANDFERGMINAMKDIAQLCGYQFAVDVGYEDIAEKVSASMSINKALLGETADSLAKAASKLNSLGYEFSDGEWLSQEEIGNRKLNDMVSKVNDMATYQIAQLLIDNNIEL